MWSISEDFWQMQPPPFADNQNIYHYQMAGWQDVWEAVREVLPHRIDRKWLSVISVCSLRNNYISSLIYFVTRPDAFKSCQKILGPRFRIFAFCGAKLNSIIRTKFFHKKLAQKSFVSGCSTNSVCATSVTFVPFYSAWLKSLHQRGLHVKYWHFFYIFNQNFNLIWLWRVCLSIVQSAEPKLCDEWHNLCSCEFPQITRLTFCWFCGQRQFQWKHS